jgi:hypothetical protein
MYLRLIILSVGCDVLVDSEALLVTDFMNLKIKLAQSFGGAHRDRVCVCVLIGVSASTCMSIYVYTVFLKKKSGLISGLCWSAISRASSYFFIYGSILGCWR